MAYGGFFYDRGQQQAQGQSDGQSQQQTTSNGSQGSGYPSSGGGRGSSGGGGASSGPSDEQKKAAANQAAVSGYNAGTLGDTFNNAKDLYNISDRMSKNLANKSIIDAMRTAGNDWFKQHLKLQNVTEQTARKVGNAMTGSVYNDIADTVAKADDLIDADTLDTQRQNIATAYGDLFEALANSVNAKNEQAMKTQSGMREIFSDYVAQINNMHPGLAAKYIDSKGSTLKNAPGWLDTNFYNKNKTGAITPTDYGFIRPDRATTTAEDQNLRNSEANLGASSGGDYWDRVRSGYNNRRLQA